MSEHIGADDYTTQHHRRMARQARTDAVAQMQHGAAMASYTARMFASFPHNASGAVYQQNRAELLYAAARFAAARLLGGGE